MAKLIECDRCNVTTGQAEQMDMMIHPDKRYSELDVHFYESGNAAINRKHLCPHCLSSLKKWLGPLPEGGT